MDDLVFAAAKALLDQKLSRADPAAPVFLSIDMYRAFVENDLICSEIIYDQDGVAMGASGRYGCHDLGVLSSLPSDGFEIAVVGTDIIKAMAPQTLPHRH